MKSSRRPRTLSSCPVAFVIFLAAFFGAPSAHSQEQQAENEFGAWGAYSLNSPDVYGSRGHQQFGVLAFRYGRTLVSSRSFAIEYTFDVAPVEIAHQYKYVSCVIESGGMASLSYCPNGHETVYGGGVSPFGWKLNLFPRRQWQLIGALSGGFIASLRPIPMDIPKATAFNFTFDFQVGVERFNSARTRAWTFAYKLQHISNASRSVVNPGVDLNMFSVGYSFFK
jgi:hypothetical protein